MAPRAVFNTVGDVSAFAIDAVQAKTRLPQWLVKYLNKYWSEGDNIFVGGGWVAEQMGLTTTHGDIDVFLDQGVQHEIAWDSALNNNYELVGNDNKILLKYAIQVFSSNCFYTDKACTTYSVAFEGEPTNVQFIVMPALCRHMDQEALAQEDIKSCREMTGEEFVMHTLGGFDLDIVRVALYKDRYISCGGGLDVLRLYFEPEMVYQMDQDSMVWAYGPWSNAIWQGSLGKWRPMDEEEKKVRREDTCARAIKYVNRLHRGHFVQFEKPVQEYSKEQFLVMHNESVRQTWMYGVAMNKLLMPKL